MKNRLFPRVFQLIGWILFVPCLIMGALIFLGITCFSGITETVVNDVVIIGIAVGALFILCSRERIEDEMTRSIRLSSLLNSLYVYVTLLVLCTLLINGLAFALFAIMNLALFPIIFVCNFRYSMYKYNKLCGNEEQD